MPKRDGRPRRHHRRWAGAPVEASTDETARRSECSGSRSRTGSRFGVLALACGLAACPGPSGPGTIRRLAGTGEAAFNGDGRPALDTAFYLVSAVRPGPDGRIHVMDFNNHRLRALEADGTVSTVAGNGEHALASPGALPTRSPLENPIDFAFTADGTLLLAPLHDPRVLAVKPGGLLTVRTGFPDPGDDGDEGPAAEAHFTELTGVAVGPDGSIYVADGGAHRVRRLQPDGRIEAFAGRGEPGFSGVDGPARAALLRRPEGLALGPDGSLYIADSGNHVVLRVDPAGTLSLVAGTGSPGFSGDGGPARSATLSAPEGVAVDIDGTVFIADTGNSRIRRVTEDGRIDTLAGTGTPGLEGDGGPARAARLDHPSRLSLHEDDLLIADMRNHCARAVQLR